jgi:hypothetical protein
MDVFKVDPFVLTSNQEITAYIKSVNIYGTSDASVTGGGALIQDKPDSPINFANVKAITSSTKIGL